MNTRLKTLTIILSVLGCFALLPQMQAVPEALPSPTPDGCYPGFTTAEGCNALANLTTGAGNTGVGWYALFFAGASNFNTGLGAGALVLNTGDSNTAVGAAALLLNTTGFNNTAVGTDALVHNDDGFNNTAVGLNALFTNTSGNFNTAVGGGCMNGNDDGVGNTGVGILAVSANVHGAFNTGLGFGAVQNNANSNNTGVGAGAISQDTIGSDNTAVGFQALHDDIIGGSNTAVGSGALQHALTGFNTALGVGAGLGVVNAHDVISIGIVGADVSDSCFIGNIRDVTTDLNDAVAVLIDSAGQLGTINSSRRFKTDIKPMDKASESVLALKPVSFRYNVHRGGPTQFGLIAEDVAEVNRDLVIYDSDGKPQTVRYEAVNAMLLNEFLKEHKKVEEQQANITELKSTVGVLTAQLKEQAEQIQKVSAQIQVNKPAPQVVANQK
jgi:Chaperone of endosialidase